MGSGCSSPKSLTHVVDSAPLHHLNTSPSSSAVPHFGGIEGGFNTEKVEAKKEDNKITSNYHHKQNDDDPAKDFNESFFTRSTTAALIHNTYPIFPDNMSDHESIFNRRRKNGTHQRGNFLKRWDSFDSDLEEESEESDSTPETDHHFYLEMTKKRSGMGRSCSNASEHQDVNKTLIGKSHTDSSSRSGGYDHYHTSQQTLFSSRRTSLVPSIQSIPEDHTWLDALEAAFAKFAKFGEMNTNVNEMNRTSWAKFCKDCAFVDNANLVTGDVDVIFIKNKLKGQRFIDFEMFMKCLDEIADRKLGSVISDPMERRELIYKSVIGRNPDLTGATEVSRTRNVRRMTDHNLYPAAHKLRFDEKERKLVRRETFASSHSLLRRRTSIVPSETDSLTSRPLSPMA